MKSKIHEIALMVALMASSGENVFMSGNSEEATIYLPKEPPVPKGCKEYFFDKYGWYSTEKMLKSETVFKCVALNNKSAKKKYQNWLNRITNSTSD